MLQRSSRRSEKGQELIEFVFVLPLLLLFLFGILEFAITILAYNTIAHSAREGARYGVIHPDDSGQIVYTVRTSSVGLDPDALQVDVAHTGVSVRVEVTYDHRLLTGMIVEAVGGNPIIRLHSVATMRVE